MENDKDKKIRTLHANLVEDGYKLPDIETFKQDMTDDNKISTLHANLVEDGYKLPALDVFKSDMREWNAADSAVAPAPPQSRSNGTETGMPAMRGQGTGNVERVMLGEWNKGKKEEPALPPSLPDDNAPEWATAAKPMEKKVPTADERETTENGMATTKAAKKGTLQIVPVQTPSDADVAARIQGPKPDDTAAEKKEETVLNTPWSGRNEQEQSPSPIAPEEDGTAMSEWTMIRKEELDKEFEALPEDKKDRRLFDQYVNNRVKGEKFDPMTERLWAEMKDRIDKTYNDQVTEAQSRANDRQKSYSTIGYPSSAVAAPAVMDLANRREYLKEADASKTIDNIGEWLNKRISELEAEAGGGEASDAAANGESGRQWNTLIGRMYERLARKGVASSSIEYIIKKAFESSFLGQIVNSAKSSVQKQIDAMADKKYDANWLEEAAAGTGSLILDAALFKGAGAAGNLTARGAMGATTRLISNRLIKKGVSETAARRLAQTNLKYEVLKNMIAGSTSSGVTFGIYDLIKEGTREAADDGRLSANRMLLTGLGGFGKGAFAGVTGSAIGNMTRNWNGGFGRFAGNAIGLTGEAATFTAIGIGEELANGAGWSDIDLRDDILVNLATVAMMKAQGKAGKFTDAAMEGKGISFFSLKGKTDAQGRMLNDLKFTREQVEELKRNGYGNVDNTLGYVVDMIERHTPDGERTAEESDRFADDYAKIMNDENISLGLKRKLMYLVEGKLAPAPLVTQHKAVDSEDGKYQLISYDYDGNEIERKTFKNGGAADDYLEREGFADKERINRIITLQDLNDKAIDVIAYNDAAVAYAEEKLMAISDVVDKLMEGDAETLKAISGIVKSRSDLNDKRSGSILRRVGEEHGVDMVKVLTKPAAERTAQENATLNVLESELDYNAKGIENDRFAWWRVEDRKTIEERIRKAKAKGETAATPEEKHEAKRRAEEMRDIVAGKIGAAKLSDVEKMFGDGVPVGSIISEMKYTMELKPEDISATLEYLNRLNELEGVREAADKRTEDALQREKQRINDNSHVNKQALVRVKVRTNEGERDGYIVNGDWEKGDVLYFKDAETGKVTPVGREKISGDVEVSSLEDAYAAAEQRIRQALEQAETEAIELPEGIAAPAVGMEIPFGESTMVIAYIDNDGIRVIPKDVYGRVKNNQRELENAIAAGSVFSMEDYKSIMGEEMDYRDGIKKAEDEAKELSDDELGKRIKELSGSDEPNAFGRGKREGYVNEQKRRAEANGGETNEKEAPRKGTAAEETTTEEEKPTEEKPTEETTAEEEKPAEEVATEEGTPKEEQKPQENASEGEAEANRQVYTRHTTDNQPTETNGVSQRTEQSGTTELSGMNTPIPADKVTDVQSEKQGNGEGNMAGGENTAGAPAEQPKPRKPRKPRAPKELTPQQKRDKLEKEENRAHYPKQYGEIISKWWDDAMSLRDYILREICSGGVKFRWSDKGTTRGLGRHLFGGDRAKKDWKKEYGRLKWLVDDEDGMTPEAYAERVCEDYFNDYERDTDHSQEVFSEILDILLHTPRSRDMWEEVLESHRAYLSAEEGGEDYDAGESYSDYAAPLTEEEIANMELPFRTGSKRNRRRAAAKAARRRAEQEEPPVAADRQEEDTSDGKPTVADIERISQNMLGHGVTVIHSLDELEAGSAPYEAISKGLNVKGWANAEKTRAFIYAPNVESVDDLMQSLRHEGVSHVGLRELLGARQFDLLCDRVWRGMNAGEREDMLAYVLRLKDGAESFRRKSLMEQAELLSDIRLRRKAADEWMAHFSEGGDYNNSSLLGRLRSWIKEALARMGFRKITVTDEDARNLLRRSENALHDRVEKENGDKKRMSERFTKQRYNSADVRNAFRHAANVVNNFENPAITEGLSSQDNVKYRFIGEKGAARLDKSNEATTRIDNLNVAREMEDSGKDAKAIKLATGWERGADEKWRYEQPDYKRTSSQGDAHPERHSLSKEEYEELERLDEEAMDASDKAKKIYKRRGEDSVYHSAAEEYVTGGMDEAKVKRYLSLSRKYDELDSTQRYLDDYIDDDDLFKAYPELKDVKLNIEYRDTNPLGGLMGSYNPETNTITLYHGFDTSTLAHEIQHSIQGIEGFAKGGNMKIVKAAKNNIRETKKAISRIFESDRDYKKWADSLDEDELNGMEGDKYDDGRQFGMYYRYLDTLEQNAETHNLREKLNNANDFIKQNLKDIGLDRSDWQDIINKDSYEIYERFAGETESRNVQDRENMTPEQRRASLAGETEDVAREDQIFLQEGMGTSEMGSKVPRRMREIKETLKDADLDDNQRAVVDAFTGDKDNTKLTIEREDGKHTVIMRQGSEGGAGTKHSLYRHYGTSVGVISADDLKLVPEILTKGECEENERGRVKLNVYRYIDNKGTVYTILTERREGHEIFNDFYTNKKAPTSASSNTPEGARSIQVEASKLSYTNASSPEGNTPEGARRGNEDFDTAKVGQSSDTDKLKNSNRGTKANDTSFRFIGEKGAERLDERDKKRTRMDDLDAAKEMEDSGQNDKVIKIITGWERGADGKWRYETPDEMVNADVLPRNRREQAKKVDDSYQKKIEKLYRMEDFLEQDIKRYPSRIRRTDVEDIEVESKRSKIRLVRKQIKDLIKERDKKLDELQPDKTTRKLEELLVDEAGDLFAAYPELKDIDVEFTPARGGVLGECVVDDDGKLKGITINKDMSDGQIRSTLMHELQHAVQILEGFARGGSSAMFTRTKEYIKNYDQNLRARALNYPAFKEWERTHRHDESSAEEYYERFANEQLEGRDRDELLEFIRDARRNKEEILSKFSLDELENTPAHDMYRRIAGETESRNVQRRLNMSDKERRETPAADTEDVPRDKQIVFGDTDEAPRHETIWQMTERLAAEAGNNEKKKSDGERIKDAEREVNVNPTDAQKEAGNYRKGHVRLGTFDITIENPAGSMRRGTDANGKAWETKMNNAYGYIRGTEGVDGDQIDVFLSDKVDSWNNRDVYVVDQYNTDGSFDEHKVMMGFNDIEDARQAYLSNYSKGWADGRKIVVTPIALDSFRKWVDSSHRKTKPFAEYRGMKVDEQRGNGGDADDAGRRLEDVADEDRAFLNGADDVAFRYGGEEREVVERARENGTYMKAPNGKPTKLNEKQWAQVRIKAFKNWFGDWEKPNRIEKLKNSTPVEISGNEYIGKYDLTRESAQRYILDNVRGKYKIEDTGETVEIAKKGAKKVTAHSQGNEAHMKSIAVIPELIKNAIFIEERPAYKDEAQYESYRYYVTGMKIGGEDYTARITIGVKNGKYYYDHYLTEIEKGNLIKDAQGFKPTEDNALPSSAKGKDKTLWSIMQINNSKVLDENGEPLVVYHGTRGDFTEFDDDKIGSNLDYGTAGKGYYFTTDRQNAENIARNAKGDGEPRVIEAYLNIVNPKRNVGTMELDGSDKKAAGFTEKAKAAGYDGIEATSGYGISKLHWFVAFDKNQIKSATDNSGEFSKQDDDITFRFIGELGAARLDKAKEATTRLANLDVARKMEHSGMDAKTIKQATGWERGADEKWRYEMPDFKKVDSFGELHPERRKLSDVESKELEDAEWDLLDAFETGSMKIGKEVTSDTDMADIYAAGGMEKERAKRLAALEQKRKQLKNTPKKLDDYIDDKELFEAYPDLLDVKVERSAGDYADGKAGSYDPNTNTLHWNDGEKSTLAHEIQHIIQRHEGFAGGGNPDILKGNTSERYKINETLEWMGKEIADSREKLEKATLEAEKLSYPISDVYARLYRGEISEEEANRQIAELTPAYEKAREARNKLARDLSHQQQQYESMNDAFDRPIGTEGYTRLMGEVESRNVESRMNMSDEERRASLGGETEDVAREEQIYRTDGDTAFRFTNRRDEGERDGVRSRKEFKAMQKEAEERRGIVMPGLRDKQVKIVSVPKHDFVGNRPIAQARKWAKENLTGTYSAIDSDGKTFNYTIPAASIDKYLSEKAVTGSDNLGVQLAVMKKLPDVIGNSIEAEVHASYIKKDGERRPENGVDESELIHRFYGAVDIDGSKYRVKTTIKEFENSHRTNIPYSYEVTKIEVIPDESETTSISGAPEFTSSKDGRLEMAKLLKDVEKSYDRGVKLLEESKPVAKETSWGMVERLAAEAGRAENEDVVFRITNDKGDKSLVGVHNISEDKLLQALELGGLANPSTAVVDINKGGHDKYGDISLVMPKSMVDKKSGRNAGTWAADAYTPRFPNVYKVWDAKSYNKFGRDVADLPDGMGGEMQNAFHYYIDAGNSPRPLSYLFLHERGEAPETVRRSPKYPEGITAAVKEIGANGRSAYDMTPEEQQKLAEVYTDYRFAADKKSVMTGDGKTAFDFLKESTPGIDTVEGIGLGRLDRFMYDVLRSSSRAGEPDAKATVDKAWNIVSEKGLSDKFYEWLESKGKEYGVQKKLYAGTTPSGTKRFIPLTLENVSKLMKKQGRAGKESFFSDSPGAVRARLTKNLNTLGAMRGAKDRLATSEEMQGVIGAINDKFYELSQMFRSDEDRYGSSSSRLADVLVAKDMKAEAKALGYELTDDELKDLQDFKEVLQNAPTEYFETKFERPVDFGEFAAAVVPSDMSLVAYGALKQAGLNVVEYERGNKQSRYEALKKACEGDGILFRTVDGFDGDGRPRRMEGESWKDFRERMDAWKKMQSMKESTIMPPEDYIEAMMKMSGMTREQLEAEMAKGGNSKSDIERRAEEQRRVDKIIREAEEEHPGAAVQYLAEKAALSGLTKEERMAYQRLMNDLGVETSIEGLKRAWRDEIILRRRYIDTSNLDVAFLASDIKKKTTKKEREILPAIIEGTYEGEVSDKLMDVAHEIEDWFADMYDDLVDEGAAFGCAKLDNYVTHIWDEHLSDKAVLKSYNAALKMRSKYTKKRVINSIAEGIGMGLVPKYDDITDIMMDYAQAAHETIGNQRLLRFMKGIRITDSAVGAGGEMVASVPLLKEADAVDPDYVLIDNDTLTGYKVHRKMADRVKTIFGSGAEWRRKAPEDMTMGDHLWKIYDVGGSFAKRVTMSLSLFHAGALTESAIAGMNPWGFAKMMGKNMIWDSLIKGELPTMVDRETARDAVAHMVQLGASSDYDAKDVGQLTRRMARWAEQYKKSHNVSGAALEKLTAFVDASNLGMDKFLWSYLHDSYKMYAYKKYADAWRKECEENGRTPDEVDKGLNNIGQMVNDQFGGQHWELLNITPGGLMVARRILLSPDWNLSALRQFGAIFMNTGLYDKNDFSGGKDLFKKRRQQIAIMYWVKAALIFGGAMNAANAMFRRRDEERERILAEQIRKTQPDYKSPYEVKYPDGMHWYDYTMLGNAKGKRTELFLGRNEDGSELYARWGKQFREVPELFDGYDIPQNIIDKVTGKMNPMWNAMSIMAYGKSISGYVPEGLRGEEKDNAFKKWTGRVGYVMRNNALPWSVGELLAPADGKDWTLVSLVMPTAKGMTEWKAKRLMEDGLKSGSMDIVEAAYNNAAMNKLDADKLMKAAISSVEATARSEFRDGIRELPDAVERFEAETNPEKKAAIRTKLMKLMLESGYKAYEKEQALEEAENYINGGEKADKRHAAYNKLESYEDVCQECEMKRIMDSTKWADDRYRELLKSSPSDAEGYLARHKKSIELYRGGKSLKSQLSKQKRMFGGDKDDEMIEAMRKARKSYIESAR